MVKTTARSTSYLVIGRGIVVLVQGLNFVVVARAFGPEQFGIYASIYAMLAMLYPLASCGAHLLLVHRFTEGFGFLHLSRFWRIIAATSPMVSGVALAGGLLILPSVGPKTVLFILLLVVSEVVMLLAHDICFAMYQSAGLIYLSVPYSVALPALRLLGNLALIGLGRFSLVTFALVQVVASGIVLLFFFRAASRDLHNYYGGARAELPTLKSDLSLGFQYAVGLWSGNVSKDIDKAMLPRLASLSSAGLYSSGFRIVDIAFLPILSLLNVMFPRFFEAGEHGTQALWRVVRGIYRWTLAYASAATLLLCLAAPLVPYILGQGYEDVPAVVRWLSPIVAIRALYYPLADALTGLRRQALRVRIQLTGVGLNAALNVLLIPLLGWLGAAIAAIASGTTVLMGMFLTLLALGEGHDRLRRCLRI